MHLVAGGSPKAGCPERQIDVTVRYPDHVVPWTQHDRLGHDLAVVVTRHRESALADLQVAHVARAKEVGEPDGIGSLKLCLTFGSDVPQTDALHHRAVLLAWIVGEC